MTVLSIFFYWLWFVFLSKEAIFLYGHLKATAFDLVTSGRYLMTALVMSGIVWALVTVASVVSRKYRARVKENRWREWLMGITISGLPLVVIMAGLSQPPLPVGLAVWIWVLLAAGSWLAYKANTYIWKNGRQAWQAWRQSWGLSVILLFVPLLISLAVRRGDIVIALVWVPVMMVASGLWLWYWRWKEKCGKALAVKTEEVLMWSLASLYLFWPLLHYIFSRPGYTPYITAMSNFFGHEWWGQLLTMVMVGVWGLTREKIRGERSRRRWLKIVGIVTLIMMMNYGALFLFSNGVNVLE